ncbi:aminodeoxychorismate lyase [Arthrobacter alpinus]|uniref:endolytic transglycosylase MltG n=1 Tax=Arthrobacter alpinus TaxID=656366 RepID=UPI0006787B97|nr:endolytic transglycosylase MltG [Arthrobacter alpinus]ALV45533.1 aminodeoxychorismate lyase [Arthrobacter alpinus]
MSEPYRGRADAPHEGDQGSAEYHEGRHAGAYAEYYEAEQHETSYQEASFHDASYDEAAYHEAEVHDPEFHESDYHAEVHHDEPYAPLPSRRSSRVSKRVQKRRRSLAFFVVVVLFIGVVLFAVQAIKPMLGGMKAADYPGPGTGAVEFVIPDGATGRTVATDLKAKDVVASEQAFLDALTAADGTAALQPGTFNLKTQMKASDAVAVLLAVSNEKVHYAAVAQNLRIGDTLAVLAEGTGIPETEFEKLANQPALFGLPAQAKNLEGYLSPGEYRFPIELDAKGILTQMVEATKKSLTDTGITDPADQYRVLTIASIIEFEGNKANYAKISGAIENRINNANGETGGRLESDATVAYGLGLKTYNITAEQKADKSNLYNTFANPGLPVGPIGSPGIEAIVAAAHPETNPYYFWVTVDLKTGETLYAATFAEHLVNVAKYTAWCEANAGECK